MCVCARAINKECHRICVCPRQRYRVAGLLEREMGHVQFVSVAWIPTCSARLSVYGGGERPTSCIKEIDLPHVLREIDRHPCICAGEE